MEDDVRYCKWCGRAFYAARKKSYCCENCQKEAARYQSWRGGKGKSGDAALRKPQNRENLYYRVAVRLTNLGPGVPIQEALGIPAWDDLRMIMVDKDAMEDLTKLENGRRLIQLLGAMQKVLSLPTTAVKSEWPVWLRQFLQAYAMHTAMYWRENPEGIISY